MNFLASLDKAIEKNNSLLCVGLDPDISKIPQNSLFEFNKKIIEETAHLVCCYKAQIAFYSALGSRGMGELKKTISYVKEKYPHLPVICDAKRGDVESTNEAYAQEVFDYLNADAITVNPYLGLDPLRPFFEKSEKGVIILCRTSNPGAGQFQDLKVKGEELYMKVAKDAKDLSKKYKNILMVIGATWPAELKKIREIASQMTFLVPGIGVQGGDLKKTLVNGLRENKKGLIIAASRSIIYAQDPKGAAQNLRNEINKYREEK